MSPPTLYKIRKFATLFFTLYHHHPPFAMAHTSDVQHFLNGSDPTQPRSRQHSGLLGSIWAPQPQPSETTWPRTLDSFSRVAERETEQNILQDTRNSTLQYIISREDVFGSPQPPQTQKPSAREIGAIGDGRKKNSPEYGDSVSLFSLAFQVCFIADCHVACRTASAHFESQFARSFWAEKAISAYDEYRYLAKLPGLLSCIGVFGPFDPHRSFSYWKVLRCQVALSLRTRTFWASLSVSALPYL